MIVSLSAYIKEVFQRFFLVYSMLRQTVGRINSPLHYAVGRFYLGFSCWLPAATCSKEINLTDAICSGESTIFEKNYE
jgi:hypothetical protein